MPPVQSCPAAHALPHAPQLVGSMAAFTQAVNPSNGQAVVPGGHVMPLSMTPASGTMLVQVPLEQNCPNAHVLPHRPQLVGSTAVFTQASIPSNGQEVRPGGHVMPLSTTTPVHVPLEQNCPSAQALPHAPQLVGSNLVSTQPTTPSVRVQAVNGDGHVHEASGGSFSWAVDCALLGVPPLPEHAASAIVPTREPTASVAAHQREGIIMILSLGGERARCRRHPRG
jgi:hypothetical protein